MKNLFGHIELRTPQISEYRLMYFFGTWITRAIICAESNAEAIFDADEIFNSSELTNWQHGVALYKVGSNKPVKVYRMVNYAPLKRGAYERKLQRINDELKAM